MIRFYKHSFNLHFNRQIFDSDETRFGFTWTLVGEVQQFSQGEVSKDLGQTLNLENLFQEVQASDERLRQGKVALESFGMHKLSINILKVDSIARIHF